MNRIQKHSFEAVSLLTADNGMIDVTIIPATNQPNWVIPSSLILSVDDYQERIWSYIWKGQEIPVFHLLPREDTPEKLVILEGNTEVHRVALQVSGELKHKKVSIADVADSRLPSGFISRYGHNDDGDSEYTDYTSDSEAYLQASAQSGVKETEDGIELPYVFQAVNIDGEICLVPDLDTMSHHMVDLDS